jgi:capsular polysaccharide biosynthesis protein
VVSRTLVRRIVIAALLGLIIGGISALVVVKRSPTYSSGTQMVIEQQQAVDLSSNDGLLRKLSLLRLQYAALAPTSVIASPAAQKLGVGERVVADGVDTSVPLGSYRLVVIGRAHTPQRARGISGAVANQLAVYAAGEHKAAGVSPADGYQLTVVSPASTPVKVSPTKKSAAKLGAAVALGVFVIALLALTLTGSRRAN